MQENYNDDDDDQIVSSMLQVREEIELVHQMYAVDY